jgi:hypothetical protein
MRPDRKAHVFVPAVPDNGQDAFSFNGHAVADACYDCDSGTARRAEPGGAAPSGHFPGVLASKDLAMAESKKRASIVNAKAVAESIVHRQDLAVLVQDSDHASDRLHDTVHDRVHASDLHRTLKFLPGSTLRRRKIGRQRELHGKLLILNTAEMAA